MRIDVEFQMSPESVQWRADERQSRGLDVDAPFRKPVEGLRRNTSHNRIVHERGEQFRGQSVYSQAVTPGPQRGKRSDITHLLGIEGIQILSLGDNRYPARDGHKTPVRPVREVFPASLHYVVYKFSRLRILSHDGFEVCHGARYELCHYVFLLP